MPLRHLLPFALPTGRDKNVGRLTVFFSPRLKDRGRLQDYQEWLDWPAHFNGVLEPNLVVKVDGLVVNHTRASPAPRSAVWTAVFGQNTPVQPHRFVDFSETPLQPMASGDFSEAVLDLYVALARSYPGGPPRGSDLVALAAAAGLPLDSSGGSGPGSLAEAAAYRAPMDDASEEEDETGPRFDFHAALSLLGHHPELLRHLGLAIDLEVDLIASPTSVGVTTGYGGGQAIEIPLVTQTTAAFLALPNPLPDFTEQVDGFLALQDEKAFLSIVDPHLAAARLTAAAELATDQDDGTLPALATRAMTLVRPDVTNAFANRTLRQAALEDQLQKFLDGSTTKPVGLFAEDVTMGHRIDVLDGRKWRSLFERESEDGYSFPRKPNLEIVPEPDEGWNTLLLVTEQRDDRPPINEDRDDAIKPTALFRLDDAMYRWDGWSGAAPPPSRTLDGTTGAPVEKDANQPDAAQAAQVAIDYRVVPGSLPRLRFGRTYRMRARCVDLAGNSVPLGRRSPTGSVVPKETFGRLEPIASPTVVRRSPRPTPGVGDTPYELVVLSDYDVLDEKVAAIDRLVFPGRVGQDLCELHGLPSGGADPASYAVLAERDALDLTDQTVTDPLTGEIIAGTIGVRAGLIEPGSTRQDVEYLSDPAIGDVRFGFPSLGSEFTVPMPGIWPERKSVRLVVAAGDKPSVPQPDPETDLMVFVPKAEIVPVDTSFAIDVAYSEHFGLWQRMTAEERASLEATIVGGAHWMFTPARPLTLVHAVRRPLLAPAVIALEAERSLGSSSIVLGSPTGKVLGEQTSSLLVHDKSTERVTLTAGWTDTVDDLAEPAPVLRSTRVELGNLLVPRGEANELEVKGLRAELHDTKRHLATIDVEAFSSFASYFTEEKVVPVTAIDEPVGLDDRGVVVGSVEVTAAGTGEKAVAGVDFIVDGTSNTIMFLGGGVFGVGDRPIARYVPLPISRTSNEPGSSKPFVLLVPNTAVPPPPAVAELIPAFAWGDDGSHSGQVLRVYVDRPWLVSGDGEQLAVILASTSVGRDPIVPGTGPAAGPVAADFPRAVSVSEGVNGAHDVVGHAVTFDQASGRWFTDIELAPTFGYRPFVRLTVARYQPDSIVGAALSPFVTLEPVRLGVVRSVKVSRSGDVADVVVSGDDVLGNAVQVTVETADAAIADPDLRWRPVGAPVRLMRDEAVGAWAGLVDLASAPDPLRVVIEELEPGLQDVDGVETPVETVIYVEAVELPPA